MPVKHSQLEPENVVLVSSDSLVTDISTANLQGAYPEQLPLRPTPALSSPSTFTCESVEAATVPGRLSPEASESAQPVLGNPAPSEICEQSVQVVPDNSSVEEKYDDKLAASLPSEDCSNIGRIEQSRPDSPGDMASSGSSGAGNVEV